MKKDNKNSKQMLFEMMQKVNPDYKPKLNENINEMEGTEMFGDSTEGDSEKYGEIYNTMFGDGLDRIISEGGLNLIIRIGIDYARKYDQRSEDVAKVVAGAIKNNLNKF